MILSVLGSSSEATMVSSWPLVELFERVAAERVRKGLVEFIAIILFAVDLSQPCAPRYAWQCG